MRGGVMIICNRALLQRALKLYRIQSVVEDPKLLIADREFPMHGAWDQVQDAWLELIHK